MAHSNPVDPIDRSRETTFPLTREQEGLWVEWKLSPTGNSYNTCIQMRLAGELSVARFRRAIADVVASFELLRSYCIDAPEGPILAVACEPFDLEVVDLTEGNTPETPARYRRALTELRRRRDAAIDLRTFPLIRAALVQTDPKTYYFIGVVPHIISDGYAAVAILDAISTAYNEGPAGLRDTCSGDHRDWRDYLAWRAEQPEQARQSAVRHWQAVLDGAEHIVPLRETSRLDQSGLADTRGARHFFSFGADRLRRFNRLARSQRTSVFAVFAALYATLLYRQTGQTDLIIVFPINVRPPGFRQAFGLFVNMLPLRVDLSGNPTFTELVAQIGQRRKLDKPHQHLPGLDIVRARREQVPGFDGRLSNVSMGQTVSRFRGLNIPGVTCTALDNDAIHVRDDLSLMYELGEDQVGLWLEYRVSAFSADEVAAMANRLLRIIDAADADPDVRIGSVPLLDPDATRAVLALGHGEDRPVQDVSYGTLFESSAACHADRPAIEAAGTTLSYTEVERKSRSLAHRLSTRPGPVAIIMNRSPSQIVALLAALRAGQPYVPLTPEQGTARLESILEAVDPAWLICDVDQLDRLSPRWHPLHLAQDHLQPHTDSAGPSCLPAVDPARPAYIIYTSGSTGRPKGVEVSHSALVCRLDWLDHDFSLRPGEGVLQNTSYAFDVSVAEILWPLLGGARLVLSDPREARDPAYLRRLIDTARISTILMVPSALQALLPQAPEERGRLTGLQRILCAGEPLELGLAEDVLRMTGARLFNVYGPTEATVYATCREVRLTDRAITIGRPIANTRVAVINDQLCVQPIGIAGELCIGGPGLARGYWRQADLTRGSFVEGVLDGGRWYRTGDRVRMTPEGELEFLGRRDGQLKVRGHRIEPGEIEYVLRRQPGVSDAAVLPWRPDPDAPAQQIVAWACFAGSESAPPPGHPLASGQWRATLGRHLPDYMIPNRLHWLDELPRLSSGKLDAARLPAPGFSEAGPTDCLMDGDEQAAAAVWAEVLGLPVSAIGRHSNFFELGGDSLILITLASRLERIGIHLDVADLFEHPTIADSLPRARSAPRVLVDQSPVEGRSPLLPRQRKFFTDGFSHPAHWNRSFVVSFAGLVDAAALQRSLETVIRHHDGLRSSFPLVDGRRWMQVAGPGECVPQLDRQDLTAIPPADRRQHMVRHLNELNASLDLTTPPLLRAVLYEEESRSTLGLVVHHLLIDMRSCQILLEDLADAYRSIVAHRPPRLPARTTSAAEWSQRLATLVDPNWQAEEVAFWATQLDRVGHPMPIDRRPATGPVDGDQRTLECSLDEARTRRLIRSVSVEAGVGVQVMLLAAFAEAFRSLTPSPWLVVNTCGIGRDAFLDGVDLTRTVGELNTVFPLSIDLTERDPLAAVDRAYAALPAKGLHYGLLRYLGRHEALQRPEPEVFFNYVSRVAGDVDPSVGMHVEMAPEGVRSSHPENRNCYTLYLESFVRDDQLFLHLGYDSARVNEATARRLLDVWRSELVAQADGRTDRESFMYSTDARRE